MKSILITLAAVSLALSVTGCRSKEPQATNTVSTSVSTTNETVVDPAVKSEAQRLLEQGNELSRQDKDGEAAEVYQKAVSLDPDLAEAHLRLAMSYIVLEKKDEAEAEFKKAAESYQKYVRQNPKDAVAFFNMGQAYSRIEKPDEAVKALRQAVRLEPENSEYQYELGIALGKAGQYQEAVNALEKSLEIDPDYGRAQDALEKAKIDLQRWQSMVRQQEASTRRQGNSNANANASRNANAATNTGGPKPEVH